MEIKSSGNNLLNISQTLNDIISDMNLNDFHSLNEDDVELNFLNTDEPNIFEEADIKMKERSVTPNHLKSNPSPKMNINIIKNEKDIMPTSNQDEAPIIQPQVSQLKSERSIDGFLNRNKLFLPMMDHNYCLNDKSKSVLDEKHDTAFDLKNNILEYMLKSNKAENIFNLESYIDSIVNNIDACIEKKDSTNEIEVTQREEQERERKEREDKILENMMDVMTAEEDDCSEKMNNTDDDKSSTDSLAYKTKPEVGSEDLIAQKDDDIVTIKVEDAHKTVQEMTNISRQSEAIQEANNENVTSLPSVKTKVEKNIDLCNLAEGDNLVGKFVKVLKVMYEEVLQLKNTANDDDKQVGELISSKMNLLQGLIRKSPQMISTGQQTDGIKFSSKKKHLRTIGSREMSTSSSSDSDTSSSSSVKVSVNDKQMRLSQKNEVIEKSGSFFDEFDDGINMSDFIQSDIFGNNRPSDSVSRHPKRVKQKFTTLLDGKKDSLAIARISEVCDSFKKKDRNNESDKENIGVCGSNRLDEKSQSDKEIDRLININALEKRPIYNGSVKTNEEDGSKAKVYKKNESKDVNFLKFVEEDLLYDSISDASVCEQSDEENITEEQYLQKQNNCLKHELLCGSSSESENFNEDDVEFVETNLEEDRSKSPLVDKFLKSFIVKENESDGNVDDEISENENEESLENVLQHSSTNNDEPLIKGNEEAKKSPAILHNDAPASEKIQKESKSKSLEKMLSEVEKRKKISKIDEDLISLSSDSNECDAESVENDDGSKKSRVIKQMLRTDQLATDTRKAQKEENERIKRLEKKINRLSELLKEQDEATQNDFILDYNEETKTFIKVHNGIVKFLKKHQFDGVKFMYDSCFGSVANLKKFNGSGCILAHCMGLGKTLQLIALLHTVISYKELNTSKVLVLCPKSTVMNWADEIRRWLGPLNTRNYRVFAFNDTSDINEKLNIIKKWSQSSFGNAGFLLVGYEAFRTLICYHSYKNRGNIKPAQLEEIRTKVKSYLLKPGADLVVCDEGHIIKNNKSAISLAVSKITTSRRIILTGTPIQNNLKEYYSMVNFIKPSFLGTEKEFANLYANPIKNGQHKDSSKLDIKIMKQRSFVLHKKLSRFVQRKEAELLKTFLPEKFEYVLFIPMTEVQNTLYEYILEAITKRQESKGRSLITDYTCLRKIWTHPKVLEDAWKNAIEQKSKKDLQRSKTAHSDDDQPDDIYDSHTGVMSVTNDWWRSLVLENQLESILPSNKLRATFEILRICEENGEKCLIFSAFVAVLNVVEYFFKKITSGDPVVLNELGSSKISSNTWMLGKDYYRLDGKTPKSLRHEMIKQFNMSENRRARVFLISAKAGGQGINLIGANRVIILDTSWNPSNDQQNIFRVFRLGQKKKCFIYRLLAMGTMEEKVYSRSVTKQAMSFRVVDEQQIDRHYSMAELTELYTLTKPDFIGRPTPVVPQDSILANLLLNFPKVVYKYHEHDSLLENKVEQELSEQEKKDAWIAYERDLQMNSQPQNMPNSDSMQHNFNPAKMMNNFGHIPPMFDMQSLAGSGLGPFSSPTNPYARGLYNYSAGPGHQQYLDMLSLYQKYLVGFSNDAFNNPLYSTLDASKSMSPGINPMVPNPLAALGDLSMYGLGLPKPPLKNPNILPQFTPPLPPVNHNIPSYTKSSHPLPNLGSNSPLGSASQFSSNALSNNFTNLLARNRNEFLAGNNNSGSPQGLATDYHVAGAGFGLLPENVQERRPHSSLKTPFDNTIRSPKATITSTSAPQNQKAEEDSSKQIVIDKSSKPQVDFSTKNRGAGTSTNAAFINNNETTKAQKTKKTETFGSQHLYGPATKAPRISNVSSKPSKKSSVESSRDSGVTANSSNPGKGNSHSFYQNLNSANSNKNTQKIIQNNEMQIILTSSTTNNPPRPPSEISPSISLSPIRQTGSMQTYPTPLPSSDRQESPKIPPAAHSNLNSLQISKISSASSSAAVQQLSKDVAGKSMSSGSEAINFIKKKTEKPKVVKKVDVTSINTQAASAKPPQQTFRDPKLQINSSITSRKAQPVPVAISKNIIKSVTGIRPTTSIDSRVSPIITNVMSHASTYMAKKQPSEESKSADLGFKSKAFHSQSTSNSIDTNFDKRRNLSTSITSIPALPTLPTAKGSANSRFAKSHVPKLDPRISGFNEARLQIEPPKKTDVDKSLNRTNRKRGPHDVLPESSTKRLKRSFQ